MILPAQLEGYGVALRRWQPADAELLHRVVLESADHLRPWMEWVHEEEPLTLEQRRAMLKDWEERWRAGGDAIYGVFVEDGVVAGGCGLHPRRGRGTLEIGYWLHPRFLRRGIATATARLLTDAAFAVPGIERVEIRHDEANTASGGVPRRLGYELVGSEPNHRAASGEVGVDWVWRTARKDWLAQTAEPLD